MSERPITRSPDLQRLRNEGFNIEIKAGHLRVKDIPYVNDKRQVKRGSLVSPLTLNGDVAQAPGDHTVYFEGDFPCTKDGTPINGLRNETATRELAAGLVVNHRFSSKPAAGRYPDFYEKMATYAAILSHPAQAIDPAATPHTFVALPSDDPDSVFHYVDTASSRAGIMALSERLRGQTIAIVGLGGTGSYVLDLIAKTHVRGIHIFDPDVYSQHNAFRAPGAPSLEQLQGRPMKVEYFATTYGRMRKNIHPHPYAIDAPNVGELNDATFVFLCLDRGTARRAIVKHLVAKGIPFIDVGMGLDLTDNHIGGILRVTTVTDAKKDHLERRLPFSDGGGNEYDTNIQVAELNAINAALAVIRWKKHLGFYRDLEKEHHTTFTLDGSAITNEEHP